jgi:hypothetical protein
MESQAQPQLQLNEALVTPPETVPFGSWKRLRTEGFQETAIGQCAIRTGISWVFGTFGCFDDEE